MSNAALKPFVILWLPPLFWMGLIFYVSSQPGTSFPDFGSLDYFAKKLAHVTEYAVLYLLLLRAFKSLSSLRTGESLMYVVPAIVGFLYAISDEIHQAFVPMRNAAVGDVLIDSLGILVGYLIARRFSGRTLNISA